MRNDLRHVIAALQLTRIDPARFVLTACNLLERALVALPDGNITQCIKRVASGDGQRLQRMLNFYAKHRICLIVNELLGDFAVLAANAQHQITLTDITNRLRAVGGMNQGFGGKTLIHRDRCIVDHFQEGHDALALAVRAFDVRTQCAHGRPVVAQTTGKFRQQRVIPNSVINTAQIIGNRGQVAGRQLRAQRTRVEQRRRRRHVIKRRQQVIELDGAFFFLLLFNRQAHRHAHKEHLWQLKAHFVFVQEIAVVEGLQT